MTDPIGFRMDLDTAEIFFKRCLERKAETEIERISILQELVAEMRALKVTEEDLSKLTKGKKVLRVSRSDKGSKKGDKDA